MQRIKGNVGRRPNRDCRNYVGDQIAVMTLLNRIPEYFGGTGEKLNFKPIAGLCPDELYKAIIRFQEVNVGSIKADGMVEPAGITLLFLNRLADVHFPIKQVNDAVLNDFLADQRLDTIQKAYQDRWNTNPQELQRMHQRERQSKLEKWRAWKRRLQHEAKGNLYGKLAIDFLDDLERKYSEPSINGWAIGFGEAYVGYDYSGDWQLQVMWGEMLATSYDKRTVLINNYGLKGAPPIILFANQTHYILKKNEVIEIKQETLKSVSKSS